jgi:hypothetical protein
MKGTPNLDRATANWVAVPDWITALADACDASSQGQVAKRLGVSPARVNQTLGNRYEGDLEKLEILVRGALMSETVPCPVVGDLPKNVCIEYYSRPAIGGNALRLALEKACPACPYNRKRPS